jgi:tRNA modification GTPase
MTDTRVAVLTPPGSSAVAVLAVRGPNAWPVIHRLFRTAGGRQLAAMPTGFVFGRLGDQASDEVILSAVAPEVFEVHCHGGQRVVSWLLGLLRANGIFEVDDRDPAGEADALMLLPFARTTRTAGILLDQAHGTFDRAESIARSGGPDAESMRALLRRNVGVGRHLTEPWTVAIAGAPNAGKSSLLNALAGFDRSVVSPIPGTTRDAVSVTLAFDGWPVELIDTAGLRESGDELEAEGIGRAREAAGRSDVVLWVVDATGTQPGSTHDVADIRGVSSDRLVVVLNKIDVAEVPGDEFPGAVRVSAVTGAGLPQLVVRLVAALVPYPPAPGDPVPFTPERYDRWS